MDQRETFKDSQQLFTFISGIYQHKQNASLLIDRDGLTRMEGIITSIHSNSAVDEASIVIDDKAELFIKEIIAINGLFRSDYSEC